MDRSEAGGSRMDHTLGNDNSDLSDTDLSLLPQRKHKKQRRSSNPGASNADISSKKDRTDDADIISISDQGDDDDQEAAGRSTPMQIEDGDGGDGGDGGATVPKKPKKQNFNFMGLDRQQANDLIGESEDSGRNVIEKNGENLPVTLTRNKANVIDRFLHYGFFTIVFTKTCLILSSVVQYFLSPMKFPKPLPEHEIIDYHDGMQDAITSTKPPKTNYGEIVTYVYCYVEFAENHFRAALSTLKSALNELGPEVQPLTDSFDSTMNKFFIVQQEHTFILSSKAKDLNKAVKLSGNRVAKDILHQLVKKSIFVGNSIHQDSVQEMMASFVTSFKMKQLSLSSRWFLSNFFNRIEDFSFVHPNFVDVSVHFAKTVYGDSIPNELILNKASQHMTAFWKSIQPHSTMRFIFLPKSTPIEITTAVSVIKEFNTFFTVEKLKPILAVRTTQLFVNFTEKNDALNLDNIFPPKTGDVEDFFDQWMDKKVSLQTASIQDIVTFVTIRAIWISETGRYGYFKIAFKNLVEDDTTNVSADAIIFCLIFGISVIHSLRFRQWNNKDIAYLPASDASDDEIVDAALSCWNGMNQNIYEMKHVKEFILKVFKKVFQAESKMQFLSDMNVLCGTSFQEWEFKTASELLKGWHTLKS